jgi:hypothetical protein
VTDEHVLLCRVLDHERRAAVDSLGGVPSPLLKEPLVLPEASLLAVVKHLTFLERWWFAHVFAGIDVGFVGANIDSRRTWRLDRRDTSWTVLRSYLGACARSRRLVERSALDAVAARVSPGDERVTLRWIYLHMIMETGRHNGQADVLRSLIDGGTGPPPCPAVERPASTRPG